MSAPRRTDGETDADKARLIAASDALRQRIAGELAPAVRFDATADRLLASATTLLRQPAVIGAVALGVALLGPRRVFGVLRWTLVTLPFHPVGRRLIPMIGSRLAAVLSGKRNGG